MRSAAATVLCLTMLFFSLRAPAQSLPLELSWQAPEECPNGERIRSELSRLTRPRAGRQLARLSARALITRTSAGYHLSLQTQRDDAVNQAQLDSSECPPLLRAATLMLALAYGDGVEVSETDGHSSATSPEASKEQQPSQQQATPTTAAPAALSPAVQPRLPAPPARQAGTLEAAPWAAATLSAAFPAQPALGAELGLQAGARHWLADLRVRGVPGTTDAQRGVVKVRVASASIELGGCAQVPLAAFTLGACARLDAGVLHASSLGARHNGSASPAWFALTPSLLAQWRVAPRWALRFELGALRPFSPPQFVVEGEGVLYKMPSASAELGFGIAWSL